MASEELWNEVKRALSSSQVGPVLRKYLQSELANRMDKLVSDPTLVLAGKAQELRKLLKDLFDEGVDTTN